MKIATAYSVSPSTPIACEQVIEQLLQQSETLPQLIVCYYSANHQYLQIAKNLQIAFNSSSIIGCSSCQGIMTASGFHSQSGYGLGLWALWDEVGNYGTALESFSDTSDESIVAATQKALITALDNAQRPGELPDLIWLHASPGYEERMIEAIENLVGKQVPIAGGSAADQKIQGHWSLFAQAAVATQGVAVAALFPGGEIGYSFHSGYVANRALGVVTASHGRTVYEIDHHPAADIYRKAIGLVATSHPRHISILKHSSFCPLGLLSGKVDQLPFFKLAHPSALTADGGIELFSEIKVGDTLYLMKGSKESLIHRGGRVTELSLTEPFSCEQPIGALVIYCAGCMLAIQRDINEVVHSIRQSLGDELPFLGAFTFGEQGHFITGENGHGNLMSSAIVFYQRMSQ
ncbi:FIST signal transduction protein [Celerinatantimonas sp. YJH-8]|uniref:FIST signal transduction protein n=1 Tax=Celerinatantimonas sp. YJH-8 TaxID=3228714 RepID=UPI0038C3D953